MIFKFELKKTKLTEWYKHFNGYTLSNSMLFGESNDSGESPQYEDVNINFDEQIGDSEVKGTKEIIVHFNKRPFIEELTIWVHIIMQKETVIDWYDKYVSHQSENVLKINPPKLLFNGAAESKKVDIISNVAW